MLFRSNRFDIVCSGHFHHKSHSHNIFYLGNHGEFTWSDFDDPKGFHIFDTETRNLEFIQNTFKIFKKFWYNDLNENFVNNKIDYSQFKNSVIRIIVTNKNNYTWFDKFIENVQSENPIELQIVEDHLNLNLENDEAIVNEAESTLDIFKKYIENLELKPEDKNILTNKIFEIYTEALEQE